MKGSAPNFSRTGSHVPETKNAAPNFRRAGSDSRRSTANRSAARKRTRKAKAPVVRSKTRSLVFSPVFRAIRFLADRGEGRAPSVQGLPLEGDPLQRLVDLLHHRLRKRGVVQRGHHLLAV